MRAERATTGASDHERLRGVQSEERVRAERATTGASDDERLHGVQSEERIL
jgi:hypothetical protein